MDTKLRWHCYCCTFSAKNVVRHRSLKSLRISLQNYSLCLTSFFLICYKIWICKKSRKILLIILWTDERLTPVLLNQLPTFHGYFTGLPNWIPVIVTALPTVGGQMSNCGALLHAYENYQRTEKFCFGWGDICALNFVPNVLGITQLILK
jgi:hypothetical protein